MSSIFSDKASLLLRHIIAHPSRKWVVRDFVNELQIGRGWAAKVIKQLREDGCLDGGARGRTAYSQLHNPQLLLEKWFEAYSYKQNGIFSYYSAHPDILDRLAELLKDSIYATTLHCGANQTTNYVANQEVHLYLPCETFERDRLMLRKKLKLLELKEGGNVHFLNPYYKSSVFYGKKKHGDIWTVSYLQLLLDLYHYPARGKEHADYLQKHLLEMSEPLD